MLLLALAAAGHIYSCGCAVHSCGLGSQRWVPEIWKHGELEISLGVPGFSRDSLPSVVPGPSEYLHSIQSRSSPWGGTLSTQPPFTSVGVQTVSLLGSAGQQWSLQWILCFAFWASVAAEFPSKVLKLPCPSLPVREFLSVQRHFLLHVPLPGVQVPVPKSFVPFLYLLPYLILRRLACLFGSLE